VFATSAVDDANANINATEDAFDEEWEEWDGKSPFLHHCIAGSLAGVAEHVMVYPLDTVRTHIQVCAACVNNNAATGSTIGSSGLGGAGAQPSTPKLSGAPSAVARAASKASTLRTAGSAAAATASTANYQNMANYGMWQTIRHLVSQPIALESAAASSTSAASSATAANAMAASAQKQMVGFTRLWRGVQTILVGCIPAHALYFSSYEIVKAATLDPATQEVTAYGSALAGAAAVFGHDVILAPLDTVKQRLQLGHYRGLSHAMQTMIQNEGVVSLYRSFPITLATNIPYGMVMVGTNEFLKQQWTHHDEKLTLSVTLGASALAGLTAAAITTPLDRIKTFLQTQQLTPACSVGTVPESCPFKSIKNKQPIVTNWQQAMQRIYVNEGMIGFFRGISPRILSHTPAVAISWTTYETAKQYLQRYH